MRVSPRPSHLLAFAGAVALSACGGGGSSKAASASAAMAADSAKNQMSQAARMLVAGALVKSGDRVLVTGSPRDYGMLEEIAIDVLKAGGQPVIAVTTDRLIRRTYTDVPESLDGQSPTFATSLANTEDVVISVDASDTENVLREISPARVAARANAFQPATQAFLNRHVRYINLGNGAYPTAEFSQRVRVPQGELASMFVKASNVPGDTLRAHAEGLRSALASGKTVTLASANGTNLTFSVNPSMVSVSDGTLKADRVHLGGMNAMTRLPAGELTAPVVRGSAQGKLVIDKLVVQGIDVSDLTLTFEKGHMTDLTATFGLKEAKAAYAAAHGAKDELAWIDIGLNPAVNLPVTNGKPIYMQAGNVTVGLGDNQLFGGGATSDLTSIFGAVGAATITIDGKVYVDKGVLK
jgi:leucyl aminopeptidase (aminopeptidase T)